MKKRFASLLPLFAAGILAGQAVPPYTEEGFRVPQPGAVLSFPEAHGAHPAFKIEWWYLTGHLFTGDGRRFGYQATFFRSGRRPEPAMQDSPFGADQIYLTHMALSDESGGRFLFAERLSRGGWDAYARTGQLEVRNGNWSLTAADPSVSAMQLQASIRSEATWSLRLEPEKPLVRFGEDGTSRKGPSPEARSYYLSFTRLKTTGTLRVGESEYTVTGSSWMDHEIASNQLDPGYVGWDWIAIQLDDGWEVKAYLLRKEDGTPAPYSALIWIGPDGDLFYRGPEAFTWNTDRLWKSPHSSAAYPIAPVIRTRHPLTGKPVTFRSEPLLEDQELALPETTYWEGAGRVYDEDGRPVGQSYLELVGYAGEIAGLR